MKRAEKKDNPMKEHFYKISLISFLCGLPNFWIEDFRLPRRFLNVYDIIMKVLNILIYIFVLMEVAAFFTQHSLSEKQKSDLLVYGSAHPILYGYRVILSCKGPELRGLLSALIVRLKSVYNDSEVEQKMIKKSLVYSIAVFLSCVLSMLVYTCDSILLTIRTGVPFSVIITAWPDVEDPSTLASTVRILSYLFWWIFMSRVCAVYALVICLSSAISHQYKQLHNYFYSLNDIFGRNDMDQLSKELIYEAAFKTGIKLHLDTMRCTRQCDAICSFVFSGQIVLNVTLIAVLMLQMASSERTLVNTCGTAITASAVLISTGFFMWNAGDVTVEASHLSTAMYYSGWNNCHCQSSRIRKLVAIAMLAAQKSVILKGLYIIDLSYSSYLSIVKSSYSVFSVLY